MPRRHILTARQKSALLDLPTDEVSLLRYYTLADDDLANIHGRRRPENKLGFALQLCVLRYQGRTLFPGERIPKTVLSFIAAQLEISADVLITYAIRRQTRQEHMEILRNIYGYKIFSGHVARYVSHWLRKQAEEVRSNEELAQQLVNHCREYLIILPAFSTIERLCADALVFAERKIEHLIVSRITPETRNKLDALLTEKTPGNISRFIWLRNFEAGNNSAIANRLLDRLEFLQQLNITPELLSGIPPGRITRLRRQGERYFTDGLQDIGSDRRLAIIAVCVVEWGASIADAIIETHDRIVGKTWREAKQSHDRLISGTYSTVTDTLREFSSLGAILLEARKDGRSLDIEMSASNQWNRLEQLVETGSQLCNSLIDEPLSHVLRGYHRFRRYVPRMLNCLKIKGAQVTSALVEAAGLIAKRQIPPVPAKCFLRPNSKWHRYLLQQPQGDNRLWEVAVVFHLRDAFRSGDIWLADSRRYGDIKNVLVPLPTALTNIKLAVPLDPHEWLADRKARLSRALKRLSRAVKNGTIPHGIIKDGVLCQRQQLVTHFHHY